MALDTSAGLTKQVKVRVDTAAVQSVPLTYVNQMIVNGMADEVILTLFQVTPPALTNEEAFNTVDSVPAQCVGRVVISWSQAAALYRILGKTIEGRSQGETSPA
jgi:hypothetical protein